ncbi:MAG: pyruvate, phosphate dikinase [Tissierellia bacterium]|nr:pyruvate, phosphate dikinase [Tissierellia bacterium]
MAKHVYDFKEGNKDMKALLGGKGANLAEMTNIGLPVPQGFTITTEACNAYYDKDQALWPELIDEIFAHMTELEKVTGKTYGGTPPLLVSVRSGSMFSMPGMMDTILNLGMNDATIPVLIEESNNKRFVLDAYRRFIQMFGEVVKGIDKKKFDLVFDRVKEDKGYKLDTELEAQDLEIIVEGFKEVYKENVGVDFPQDPRVQLLESVEAVFASWNNNRAIVYRKENKIPHNLGTGVNIQSMVFGNMGDDCGTGVAFTRDPATGQAQLFGEFLMNAQGEDVVAGIRTPMQIEEMKRINDHLYHDFANVCEILENHYRDMQDIEFTIEKGVLYILQTRSGKRTAQAALKIAIDMVDEGLIDKNEALLRIAPEQIDQLLHPAFDKKALAEATVISQGLNASPGAASGQIYFNAEDAVKAAEEGIEAILVREETSPEDLEGMIKAVGILTAKGGRTSHAAVVARGMGKCCVAGCEAIHVEEDKKIFTHSGKVYKEGDFISLDGSTGFVYEGVIETTAPTLDKDFETLMSWADEVAKLRVRTNADTPQDAAQAISFGARGIGLTRTEHMFFEGERISAVRQMIVAQNEEDRVKALDKILPYQQDDFEGIFEVMKGLPVTIRLLDPPLHEFLPQRDKDIENLAKEMGIGFEDLKSRVVALNEVNPMLGHRGCRLAISYPEIAAMQTRAIIQAALEVTKRGIPVMPEIMVPLVGTKAELDYLEEVVRGVADKLIEEAGVELKYSYGTMIEVPRGTLTADKIAEGAEFFSFGTNDLTQMTYGFSRDDAAGFINEYLEKGIFKVDPFVSIDPEGVGALMKIAVEKGRKTRPDIGLGICGEHGGDPDSVKFCHSLGLDYVSCSPFRVPIARLAAAHAVLEE